jgi:hypothetical protein
MRVKTMRVFGYSIPMILVLAVVFILGAKNPGVLARIPLVNRI